MDLTPILTKTPCPPHKLLEGFTILRLNHTSCHEGKKKRLGKYNLKEYRTNEVTGTEFYVLI